LQFSLQLASPETFGYTLVVRHTDDFMFSFKVSPNRKKQQKHRRTCEKTGRFCFVMPVASKVDPILGKMTLLESSVSVCLSLSARLSTISPAVSLVLKWTLPLKSCFLCQWYINFPVYFCVLLSTRRWTFLNVCPPHSSANPATGRIFIVLYAVRIAWIFFFFRQLCFTPWSWSPRHLSDFF